MFVYKIWYTVGKMANSVTLREIKMGRVCS